MSIRAINWAWEQDVKPVPKLVLVKLADHANDDGRCWPSVRTIKKQTGLSRDSVLRATRYLESKGLLTVIHRTDGRLSRSNVYRLHYRVERLEERAQSSANVMQRSSSAVRPLSTESREGVVAQSGQGSSMVSPGAVAGSGPNHHIEPSIEPSVEPSIEPCVFSEDTHALSEKGQGKDIIQRAEAKRLFERLSEIVFGRPFYATQWPPDLERCLDEALPMKLADLELLTWFYRLPCDHAIFRVTQRRQSMRAVIENLDSEVQKIESALKVLASLEQKEKPLCEEDGWTPELLAAACRSYHTNEHLFTYTFMRAGCPNRHLFALWLKE